MEQDKPKHDENKDEKDGENKKSEKGGDGDESDDSRPSCIRRIPEEEVGWV